MTDRDHTPDDDRATRIGFDEAILCDSKLPEHVDRILTDAASKDNSLLLTRLSVEKFAGLAARHRERINYDPVSRTAWFGQPVRAAGPDPEIALVTAGTSDVPVAREVARTLEFNGVLSAEIYDVGVAGVWRLMERVDEISQYPVVVAVAGMDAALPSVLGGLVPGLIIAVPTSVGYGVATGGHTALNALLASCAPGICVVNIDNGYGGACAALRALNAIKK